MSNSNIYTGPKYYRSFASYQIPFRGDRPVEFAETEASAAFCAAYFDANGRVAQFDKHLMEKLEKEPRSHLLDQSMEPESNICFKLVRDPATGKLSVGERIEYVETEHLSEFFAGEVDPSGNTCRLWPFRRTIMFSDAYEYWPNGQLRTRTMTQEGRPTRVVQYGYDGASIAGPISPPAESTAAMT